MQIHAFKPFYDFYFSFCVILLVNGPTQYNDSVTDSFRRLPTETVSITDKFSYIDTATQAQFLTPLAPISGVTCSSELNARPVKCFMCCTVRIT